MWRVQWAIIAVFYGLNLLVERLPKVWRLRLLPWGVCGANGAAAGGLPGVSRPCAPFTSGFFDNRSENFVGLQNYIFAFTDPDMLIAFRNNVLWLVLVTVFSVALGLVNWGGAGGPGQLRALCQGADLSAHGHLLCGGQRDLAVHLRLPSRRQRPDWAAQCHCGVPRLLSRWAGW